MRKNREKIKGARYKVVATINEAKEIFKKPEVIKVLKKTLNQALGKFNLVLERFSLFKNGIELIIQPLNGEDLSRIMQWFLGVFALRYNKTLGRKGHVWYDRFKSWILDKVDKVVKTVAENFRKWINQEPQNKRTSSLVELEREKKFHIVARPIQCPKIRPLCQPL